MALSHDALWNKSKLLVARALTRRDSNELEEFQLWATVAIEVLAKSALAHVHPCLVADPTHLDSMLVACGASTSTDYRTIAAKTLFERCKRLVKGFDEGCEKFCKQLAHDRDAELHSSLAPFVDVGLDTWQSKYWSCTKILVEAQRHTLVDYIGDEEAVHTEAIIQDASRALVAAVQGRIKRHAADFRAGRSTRDLEQLALVAKAAFATAKHSSSVSEDPVPCPACECAGILSGDFQDERELEVTQDGDPDEYESWTRWVEEHYSAERFQCVACSLELEGMEELEAAELPAYFDKTVPKEYDEGEGYGND